MKGNTREGCGSLGQATIPFSLYDVSPFGRSRRPANQRRKVVTAEALTPLEGVRPDRRAVRAALVARATSDGRNAVGSEEVSGVE